VSATTLALAGGLSIVTGLAFAIVARAVSQRMATEDRRLARRAHAAWWLCLGAYLVLQGALTILAGTGRATIDLYLASRIVAIPLLCASVWGLTFYLVFLYTGSTRAAIPLGVLYAAAAAVFFYATFSVPQALIVRTWLIGIEDSGPLYRFVYAIIGLPPILASVAYFGLLRRARQPEQRYRIALLGGSILAYIGSGLAARLFASDAAIFATLVVMGLGAAAASLAAYYPPAFVRRALEAS
jgi:hypothetical protein